MTRLSLLPLLLLATCLSAAPRIRQYRITLEAQADGSGLATATLNLEDCAPGTLVIPMGLNGIGQLRAQAGPAGLGLEPGAHSVRVQLPAGVPPACTVAFSFPVAQVFQPIAKGNTGAKPIPAGNRLFHHALVNTQESPIEDYRFELRLAEGWLVQTIREQAPKLGKGEAGPRVRLDKAGARQGAVLHLAAMAQGDDTAMTLELTPARKSLLWLLVGLVLGGLYLWRFRDLVAARRP